MIDVVLSPFQHIKKNFQVISKTLVNNFCKIDYQIFIDEKTAYQNFNLPLDSLGAVRKEITALIILYTCGL